MNTIVIAAARRTPIGAYRGILINFTATSLSTEPIRAVVADAGIDPGRIDECYMGCVLPAGLGQAPARQAALGAGLPLSTSCTTVNKVCGSGMKAVMLGADAIKAETAMLVIAGGMESMSNAPYLIKRFSVKQRPGHQQLLDHMFYDGLENAADRQLMGYFAEQCADRFGFTREEQDAYAAESVCRAIEAIDNGAFKAEICAMRTPDGACFDQDEIPAKCDLAKIPKLKPVFWPDIGTVTAANASSIADGAAALLLMPETQAERHAITPLARIVAYVTHAQAPEEFTTAPIGAIQKLYAKTGWTDKDVDLYEINEAFAVVSLVTQRELRLDHAKINVNGGACALGHPIGATGARIIVTLIHTLKQRGLRRGIAALCIGGGEATAIAIECK